MKPPRLQNIRVLGIAPSSRGFGFAVIEGKNTLVDWGVKSVKGDKNARSLSNVGNLITRYRPDVIALEAIPVKSSRRSSRVRALMQEIVTLAGEERIKVKRFARRQLNIAFFGSELGTKHALAECLAARFSDQLGFRLPRKRRAWMSEGYQMDIFDAVALADHWLRTIGQG